MTREEIVRQVSDAVHQLEEAKLTLAAGQSSLELARKSLAADQRKYELGAETNFFVLDSQTKLAQSELDLLQTQIKLPDRPRHRRSSHGQFAGTVSRANRRPLPLAQNRGRRQRHARLLDHMRQPLRREVRFMFTWITPV